MPYPKTVFLTFLLVVYLLDYCTLLFRQNFHFLWHQSLCFQRLYHFLLHVLHLFHYYLFLHHLLVDLDQHDRRQNP